MRKWENGSRGFTLIEIMVATVITVMIIGSVYAAFRTSLKAYQGGEVKMIMLRRVRFALDRMAWDIGNLFYAEEEDTETETAGELILMVEDLADGETGIDQDMLSFVAVVNPNLDDYYAALEQSEGSISVEEEEENPLPSDLARIIYYVGPSPEDETVLSLMRIETTTLGVEEIEDMLENLLSAAPSEELEEELRSAVLIDYVAGLNIRYFDGEEWVDTWDMEEEMRLPSALEITLTVTDADTKEKTLTEAIVVYLPMSDTGTDESDLGTGVVGGTAGAR